MANIGVYIHIPFCVKKCDYCDFVSYAGKNELMEDYVDALCKEIEHVKLDKYNIRTIYLGGGTPSILDIKLIQKIFSKIDISSAKEITIEINPGTCSKEKLEGYLRCGINRLSIGLQSTDNGLLKQIRKNS